MLIEVQYRNTAETSSWLDLGLPVVGNGTQSCISDNVPTTRPHRIYRILRRDSAATSFGK